MRKWTMLYDEYKALKAFSWGFAAATLYSIFVGEVVWMAICATLTVALGMVIRYCVEVV